ncbi:MAG: WD40 repeat domain-containing protein [Pirellulales bacterium]|nr:WD40 repeat domain-containing protein [Pirellulales bacterium]
MEFSQDGGKIAISHGEHGKVLDWISGKEISRLQQCGNLGVADFSSDGKIVSYFSESKDDNRDACIWSAEDGRVVGHLKLPADAGTERCVPFFSPDNRKIVAEYPDGILIWDLSDLAHVGRVKISRNRDPWMRTFLSWHPVTHEMICANADGKLLKVDLQKETAVPLLTKPESPTKGAQWSPDGRYLVAIGRNEGSVLVWDVQAKSVVAKLPVRDVLYACFSPNSDRVATMAKGVGPWGRRTQIWDASSGKMICELPTTAIVTFSPDWSYYVEAGEKGVRIAKFDGTESCEYSGMFDGHGSICRFSPDNRYLARVNASGLVDVMQHNEPIRSWIQVPAFYQFWMIVLALAGLMWIVRARNSTERQS